MNWIIVSDNPFKMAISKEGWTDEWYLTGALAHKRHYAIYGGHPVNTPENYQKNSSLFHAQHANTPTLFLMGNPVEGGIDKYDSVRWLYHALQEKNIKTQYIFYPDEGHLFEQKNNLKDAFMRSMEWIESIFNKSALRNNNEKKIF